MRHKIFPSILAVALAFSAVLPAVGEETGSTYALDPVHSAVLFTINHAGVSNTHGRFNDVRGSLVYDAGAKSLKSVEVFVKTESVDTHNEKRDQHLRSADIFNSAEFPEITFKSTKIAAEKDGKFTITGDLTFHGTKKSITVTAVKIGENPDMRGKAKVGFETTFTINRMDYGVNYAPDGMGREVTLTVAIEAEK